MWEVRIFTGRDPVGNPTQVSRTVHGTKKDAQRLAAELTLKPSNAAGRTVSELIDAWVELNEAGWAPATLRDQRSRAELIKADPLAKIPLARLTLADVDRWHTRLRMAGVGDAGMLLEAPPPTPALGHLIQAPQGGVALSVQNRVHLVDLADHSSSATDFWADTTIHLRTPTGGLPSPPTGFTSCVPRHAARRDSVFAVCGRPRHHPFWYRL